MKKFIFPFIFLACLANLSAQLKVDGSGNVLLGSSASNSDLDAMDNLLGIIYIR
jgi:hypothetical protein